MNYKISLTENQVALILAALNNESIDDQCEFGEYSYSRCWKDFAKKVIKQGFWSDALENSGEF